MMKIDIVNFLQKIQNAKEKLLEHCGEVGAGAVGVRSHGAVI